MPPMHYLRLRQVDTVATRVREEQRYFDPTDGARMFLPGRELHRLRNGPYVLFVVVSVLQ